MRKYRFCTFYSNLVEISGETNIFAAFDADTLSGLNDGDDVSKWDDLSTNSRHLLAQTGANTVIYEENGVDTLPSIKFAAGQLETNTSVPTPVNGVTTTLSLFASTVWFEQPFSRTRRRLILRSKIAQALSSRFILLIQMLLQ